MFIIISNSVKKLCGFCLITLNSLPACLYGSKFSQLFGSQDRLQGGDIAVISFWGDLCGVHTGKDRGRFYVLTIQVKNIGNPLTYRDGFSFTWANGRQFGQHRGRFYVFDVAVLWPPDLFCAFSPFIPRISFSETRKSRTYYPLKPF